MFIYLGYVRIIYLDYREESTKESGKQMNFGTSCIFFYSLPAFESVVPEKYFQHWMLFVISLYLHNQDTMTESDLHTAEILIRMFLRDFVDLYKAEEFTSNMHQLLHLPLYTRGWGPMWAIGDWNFESFNGILACIIHGSKHQAKELIINLRIAQGVQLLRNQVAGHTETVCKNFNIAFSNKPQAFSFTASDLALFAMSNVNPNDVTVFSRVTINRKVFSSVIYARQTKRNNSTVAVEVSAGSRQYGVIRCFLEHEDGRSMAILNLYKVNHLKTFFHKETMIRVSHIIPVEITEDFILISIQQILFKVIQVGHFVCLFPNQFEIYM